MKWNLSTVLFWVFLFALVFNGVSSVYSEQADITKAELMTLLDEREYFKEELANFKESFNLLDQKYMELDKKYQDSENELHKLKIESSLRIDSLTILKKEISLNYWKGFLTGSLAGFGAGTYAGIKIAF